MLWAYETIGKTSGDWSSSRVGRVLAEPPRSHFARTGRITQRDAQANTRFTARRSGAARRSQPGVVYLAGAGTRYSCFRAIVGKPGARLATGRERARPFVFPRTQTAPSS